MRVGVIGAGAIGTLLASQLHQTGDEVTVIARPEYVATVSSNGLRLRVHGTDTLSRVRVVSQLTEPQDVFLLAVKCQDVAAACEAVRQVAPDTTAVTLQNGVRADSIAASILGIRSVVGAITMCAVTSLEPGVASLDVPGWFILGTPPGGDPARLGMVRRLLGRVAPTYVSRNLEGARWSKLLANLANGVSAATGLSFSDLVRSPVGRRLAVKVMREGHAVVRAAHIRLDRHVYGLKTSDVRSALLPLVQSTITSLLPSLPEPVSLSILGLAGRSSMARVDFRGSTWQSLVRGKPTEIDFLNGEVVRMGTTLRVATPYNARVVDAVHAAEASQPALSLYELWRTAA